MLHTSVIQHAPNMLKAVTTFSLIMHSEVKLP